MSDYAHLERFALPKRCGDCAFTKGTDAEQKSGLIATLCVEAGEPFYCHERRDGTLQPRMLASGDDAVMCRGFVEAMRDRPDRPAWYEAAASEMIKIADEGRETKREIDMDEIRERVIRAGTAAALETPCK